MWFQQALVICGTSEKSYWNRMWNQICIYDGNWIAILRSIGIYTKWGKVEKKLYPAVPSETVSITLLGFSREIERNGPIWNNTQINGGEYGNPCRINLLHHVCNRDLLVNEFFSTRHMKFGGWLQMWLGIRILNLKCRLFALYDTTISQKYHEKKSAEKNLLQVNINIK